MEGNVSFSLGPLALIERIEQEFNFFGKILEWLDGKAKHLPETTKLLIYNKLCKSLSVSKLKNSILMNFSKSWDLKKSQKNIYHFVFVIKYGKDLFLYEKYVETVKKICKSLEERYVINFETIGFDEDYLHFLLESFPKYSPSQIFRL